jgi:quercetin dioxygenase-like cupin family protein
MHYQNITELEGKYTFCCEKENENHESGTVFFVYKTVISEVKSLFW